MLKALRKKLNDKETHITELTDNKEVDNLLEICVELIKLGVFEYDVKDKFIRKQEVVIKKLAEQVDKSVKIDDKDFNKKLTNLLKIK